MAGDAPVPRAAAARACNLGALLRRRAAARRRGFRRRKLRKPGGKHLLQGGAP